MNTNLRKAENKLNKIVGSEPKQIGEVSNSELGRLLSWYASNKDAKDSQKYAKDYLTKQKIRFTDEGLNKTSRQFGFVCRIITNGSILSEKEQVWFDENISKVSNVTEEKSVETTKSRISIQDRINEQADAITSELEGAIDDFIASGCKKSINTLSIMFGMKAKYVHVKRILEIIRKYRAEFDMVLNTTDSDIQEGYSNFSKLQLKKLIAFCDQIIKDALTITDQTKVVRKARKTKVKPAAIVVSKLKYQKEFDLDNKKLVSVNPEKIVGSSQIFVFNTKTNKLGVYHAADGSGLSVKGSTLTGFDQTKSVCKTLRKPIDTLTEVLTGSKIVLRKVLTNIKTKEYFLTGRINDDTVILRVE